MFRDYRTDYYYLLHRNAWLLEKLNNQLTFGLEHPYTYKRGNGLLQLNMRTPFVFSDYDFSALNLSCVNKNDLGKLNFNTRFFAQIGTGNSLPLESMLYAYGANPEEMMENKYTRSAGILPSQWGGFGITTNHLLAAGGLNLRGYGGYLLPYTDKGGNQRYMFRGTSGASFNAELEFGELLSFKKSLLRNIFAFTPYLFADAGTINVNYSFEKMLFSPIMADAGIGCALTIKKWWKLQTAKPLTIRFDAPLFINRLPFAENNFVQFRWMLGINRAF